MKNSFDDDTCLLSGCLLGKREALESLVGRFSDLVYRSIQYTLISKGISFNKDDLEDLHNTVFLKLFEKGCKKLRQYQGRNGLSVASWIRMITVRVVIDHLRKRGIDNLVWKKEQISLDNLPELKAESVKFVVGIDRTKREQLLKAGMEGLPSRQRLFISLYFFRGLSTAEIAEAMHLSMTNAYTIKHRAIQRLKSYIYTITNLDT